MDPATITMINTSASPEAAMVADLPRTDSLLEAEDLAAVATQQAVETVTRYSWFYYEREDQFEGLFESLNLKGQRERKLQENLKKIKDRLKLKRPRRANAPKSDQQSVAAENGAPMPESEG